MKNTKIKLLISALCVISSAQIKSDPLKFGVFNPSGLYGIVKNGTVPKTDKAAQYGVFGATAGLAMSSIVGTNTTKNNFLCGLTGYFVGTTFGNMMSIEDRLKEIQNTQKEHTGQLTSLQEGQKKIITQQEDIKNQLSTVVRNQDRLGFDFKKFNNGLDNRIKNGVKEGLLEVLFDNDSLLPVVKTLQTLSQQQQKNNSVD